MRSQVTRTREGREEPGSFANEGEGEAIRPRADVRTLLASHKVPKETEVRDEAKCNSWRERPPEPVERAGAAEERLLEQVGGFLQLRPAEAVVPISNEQKLDEALCDYSNLLYLDGYGSIRGEAHGRARVREAGVCQEWNVGSRRLAPTQTRMPMLEFVKGAISGVMIQGAKPPTRLMLGLVK